MVCFDIIISNTYLTVPTPPPTRKPHGQSEPSLGGTVIPAHKGTCMGMVLKLHWPKAYNLKTGNFVFHLPVRHSPQLPLAPSFFSFVVLGFKPRASHMLSKCYITKLHPWPFLLFLEPWPFSSFYPCLQEEKGLRFNVWTKRKMGLGMDWVAVNSESRVKPGLQFP